MPANGLVDLPQAIDTLKFCLKSVLPNIVLRFKEISVKATKQPTLLVGRKKEGQKKAGQKKAGQKKVGQKNRNRRKQVRRKQVRRKPVRQPRRR